jgi:hypothetical protein
MGKLSAERDESRRGRKQGKGGAWREGRPAFYRRTGKRASGLSAHDPENGNRLAHETSLDNKLKHHQGEKPRSRPNEPPP